VLTGGEKETKKTGKRVCLGENLGESSLLLMPRPSLTASRGETPRNWKKTREKERGKSGKLTRRSERVGGAAPEKSLTRKQRGGTRKKKEGEGDRLQTLFESSVATGKGIGRGESGKKNLKYLHGRSCGRG